MRQRRVGKGRWLYTPFPYFLKLSKKYQYDISLTFSIIQLLYFKDLFEIESFIQNYREKCLFFGPFTSLSLSSYFECGFLQKLAFLVLKNDHFFFCQNLNLSRTYKLHNLHSRENIYIKLAFCFDK